MGIFSEFEIKRRLESTRKSMQKRNLDLLIVNTPENVTYLTGHQSPGYYMYMALLVPVRGEPVLVLRRGELGNAKTYSWIDHLVPYDDTDNPILKTLHTIKEYGMEIRRVGFEFRSWFLTVRAFEALKQEITGSEIVDASDLIEQLRMVKSDEEINYIREACRQASFAMNAAYEIASPGVSEAEIAGEVLKALCRSGCEYLGTEPYVVSGPRIGSMHASWTDRRLEKGEALFVEIAGTRYRYNGALMRTFVMGDPKDKRIALWSDVCIEALEAAIHTIRPGVTSHEVDEACRGVIEKAGLFENFRKRTGYSIGLAFAPDWGEGQIASLQKGDERVLSEGMVFHIPPALREYGALGVGFSETIVVTRDGCELLTDYPRRLKMKG